MHHVEQLIVADFQRVNHLLDLANDIRFARRFRSERRRGYLSLSLSKHLYTIDIDLFHDSILTGGDASKACNRFSPCAYNDDLTSLMEASKICRVISTDGDLLDR